MPMEHDPDPDPGGPPAGADTPFSALGREPGTGADGRLRHALIMTSPVAQLVVGPDGQLALLNRRAGAMLGLSESDVGRWFSDLEIAYTIDELGPRMAAALAGRDIVVMRHVPWRCPSQEPGLLDVQLLPLLDEGGDALGLSITLTDVTRVHDLEAEVDRSTRKLETANEELWSTNEELETTNEELQSTVEELETTNEELQSTNEELESMTGRLQSTSDELQLINQQLRERTFAVTQLHDLMQSIFHNLESAVIVVNKDLVVQVWSDRSQELWGLREQETVGQQLLSLDSGLPVEELRPWLLDVVSGGRDAGVYGHHISAVNRRGRRVDLRVTVTAMTGDSAEPTGALVLFEELSPEDVAE